MTGQADTAPGTTDDLAQFLVDNPEADAKDDPQNDDEPGHTPDNSDDDETQGDDPGGSPDPDDEVDPDADDPDAKPDADQTSGAKFKVTVKGDDGADSTIEVDQKELIAGYQRHSDYTRKTQDLATREREAYQVVSTKLKEGSDYYMEQAALAHAAVRQLAGLRTPEEMAALSQTDYALWAQEIERTNAIQRVLSQLETGVMTHKQHAEQQGEVQLREEMTKAWSVLEKEGLDRPKVKSIFDGIAKEYGVPEERFKKLSDPKLVMIMRDAMAFRGLKTKAATVKGKVREAPQLPAARQSVPERERVNKRINERFKGGKAKVDDLAAFLSVNKHL